MFIIKLNFIAVSNSLSKAKPHSHSSYEIILNLSGKGISVIDGNSKEFKTGTISICPPGTTHFKYADKGIFRDIYVSFDDDKVFQNLKNLYFEDDCDGTIKNLLFMINNIYHKKEQGYKETTLLLLEAVCSILVNQDKTNPASKKFSLIQNEIIKNFTNPEYKISDSMNKVNYCNDYIRRQFKKEVKMTPVEYLNHLRITYAKKLLRNNRHQQYSIIDIAYMSGFYDASYFSRAFKKTTGVSPTEYEMTY